MFVLAHLFVAPLAVAQTTWTEPLILYDREQHAMAYDPVRQRALLFGGTANNAQFAGTWEWDGRSWSARAAAIEPSPRSGHSLVWDTLRGVGVLFGGDQAGVPSTETWEWDGTTWTQRQATPPSGSYLDQAMAYDAGRGVSVLVLAVAGAMETWEWDGAVWRRDMAAPPFMTGYAMAFDVARQRTVLVGARNATLETWEWDGSSWTQGVPAALVGPRDGHTLTYDASAQRVLLVGGLDQGSAVRYYSDVWSWDGLRWTPLPGLSGREARAGHAAAFDAARGVLVLFGGRGLAAPYWLSDTFEFDGWQWLELIQAMRPTANFAEVEAAFDSARGRSVFVAPFGGIRGSVVWEWDGSTWHQPPAAVSVPARLGTAIAYDEIRQTTVLFGGLSSSGALGDTWAWDGSSWTQHSPAISPTARSQHAMTFDPRRGKVVLFGGADSAGVRNDVWEWDGTTWAPAASINSPPPRSDHAMAFDTVRNEVVVFGGSGLADTWLLGGSTWRQGPAGPPARSQHAMAFHHHRQRTIVYGGVFDAQGQPNYRLDTWEWDGLAWLPLTVALPGPRVNHALAYDAQNHVILFGGEAGSPVDEFKTWVYLSAAGAEHRSFGPGCGGSLGPPRLAARGFSLPWIGDQFVLQVSNLPGLGLTVLAVGGSSTSWRNLQLPVDLSVVGMTGCTAYCSQEVVVPIVPNGGVATFGFTVPLLPAMVGQSLYEQAFVPDFTANPLGLIASNAGKSTVGQR